MSHDKEYPCADRRMLVKAVAATVGVAALSPVLAAAQAIDQAQDAESDPAPRQV